jgi:hypothetical protein
MKLGISECIPSLSYTQLNSEYTQLNSEYTQLNLEYTQQLGVHSVELGVHSVEPGIQSVELGIHYGFMLRYTRDKCRVEGPGGIREHGRMAWGDHGLPKVSFGPTMPYSSTPCGQATPDTAVSCVACLQGGRPAAVFFPFGHPPPCLYVRERNLQVFTASVNQAEQNLSHRKTIHNPFYTV